MKGCLDYLQDVSEAQAARQTGQGSTYCLVIREQKIVCIPKKHSLPCDFVLGTVTEYQCTQGMTGPEWQKITDRIAVAIKEKRL